MVEKIITVKSTEQTTAKNNTPYLKVISQDDKTYSIFDQSLWNLFGEGLAIKLGLEKKGNFWNVVSAESVEDVFAAQATKKVQAQAKDAEMSKEDWALKARLERESIETQVAFKGMIELIVAGKLNPAWEVVTINWAMERLDLPTVIMEKIVEAKDETIKTVKGSQEAQGELTDRQDSGKETERIAGFFKYLENHGIQDVKTFLEAEYKTDIASVTPKICEALYKTIKKDKGWA